MTERAGREVLDKVGRSQQRGAFFAFEGIDGSGKTTQVRLLAERLRCLGGGVHVTSEPTTGPIGALIRQMMSGRIVGDHRTIAALFVADRIDHLVNPIDGVLELLQSGLTVVTDRYYFSSYAYHSLYVELDWVIHANSVSASILRPDLTIFLDVPPRVAAGRLQQRRTRLELYETIESLTATELSYKRAFELLRGAEHFTFVAGEGSEQEIHERVWRAAQVVLSTRTPAATTRQ